MRKILTFTFFVAFALTNAKSQDTTKISLDNFRTPTIPASTILNLGTQSVTRPTTPKGLATSFLSSFSNGTLNPNMGIEFNPYWLKPKRELTFENFYNLNNKSQTTEQNIGDNLLRNLSLSLATTKLDDKKDTLNGTRLSLGVRTQIVSGKISSETKLKMTEYSNIIDVQDAIYAAISRIKSNNGRRDSIVANTISIDRLENLLVTTVNQNIVSNQQYDELTKEKLIISAREIISKKIEFARNNELTASEILKKIGQDMLDKKESALAIQALEDDNKNRVGLIWEIAMAGVQYFPNNNYQNSEFNKLGIWSTISYRSENKKDEFGLLVRYMANHSDSNIANIDLGISYNRLVSTGFNYGFEALYRGYNSKYKTKDINGVDITAINSNSTYRMAILVEYKLNDVMLLNASIGKDFDSPFTSKGNLLTLVGLIFSMPSKNNLLITK